MKVADGLPKFGRRVSVLKHNGMKLDARFVAFPCPLTKNETRGAWHYSGGYWSLHDDDEWEYSGRGKA